MPDRLDSDMAEHVHRYLQGMGIRVITKHKPFEIIGNEKIGSVNFNNLTLPADILLFGTDFMPEVALAKRAGFDIDEHGININEKARVLKGGKAVEGVFASGACAQVINKATGKEHGMKPLYG